MGSFDQVIRVHKQRKKYVVRRLLVAADGTETWEQIDTFSTRRDATAYRDSLIAQPPSEKMPINRFIDDFWLAPVRGMKPTAAESRKWAGAKIKTAFGTRPIGSVTQRHVESAVNTWQETLSPRSVAALLKRVREVFKLAMDDGLIRVNPAAKVKPPKIPNAKRPTWSPEELQQFLTIALDHRHAAAWWLVSATGLRRGELLGLEWTNLDWEAGTIQVVKTVVDARGKPLIQDDGKTVNAGREMPLDPVTLSVLREHRKRQLAEYDRYEVPKSRRSGFVFTAIDGDVQCPRSFHRTYMRLCDSSSVPPIHLHDIRHTFATQLLRHVTSMAELLAASQLMGHSTYTTTIELYGHALDTDMAQLQAKHGESLAKGLEHLLPAQAVPSTNVRYGILGQAQSTTGTTTRAGAGGSARREVRTIRHSSGTAG